MKKLAVIVLLFIALKYGAAAALTIVYLAAVWWAFIWLLRKIGISKQSPACWATSPRALR